MSTFGESGMRFCNRPCTCMFGACLAALGRFEEAEPLVLTGWQQLAGKFGPEHKRTHFALDRVIEEKNLVRLTTFGPDFRGTIRSGKKRAHSDPKGEGR